jgi:hypothetical protein
VALCGTVWRCRCSRHAIAHGGIINASSAQTKWVPVEGSRSGKEVLTHERFAAVGCRRAGAGWTPNGKDCA